MFPFVKLGLRLGSCVPSGRGADGFHFFGRVHARLEQSKLVRLATRILGRRKSTNATEVARNCAQDGTSVLGRAQMLCDRRKHTVGDECQPDGKYLTPTKIIESR